MNNGKEPDIRRGEDVVVQKKVRDCNGHELVSAREIVLVGQVIRLKKGMLEILTRGGKPVTVRVEDYSIKVLRDLSPRGIGEL